MTTIPELYQRWLTASEECAAYGEDEIAFNAFCDREIEPVMSALLELSPTTLQELAMKFRVFDDAWPFNPMKAEIDALILGEAWRP